MNLKDFWLKKRNLMYWMWMAWLLAICTVILVYQLCLHRDGSTSQFVFCLHFSMISGKIHSIFTIICVSITLTIIKSIIFISLEKNQVVGKSGAVTRSTNWLPRGSVLVEPSVCNKIYKRLQSILYITKAIGLKACSVHPKCGRKQTTDYYD